MASEEIEYNVNLIIEDGTNVPMANSYISLAFADSYAISRNYSTWTTLSDYVKSAAIIKAMDYVDNIFNWRGQKLYRDQPLSFPRKDIVDDDGYDRTGEIPIQLKKAICEAAFYVYKKFTLYSSQDPNGVLKKDRKKADVTELEKEYFSSSEVTIDYTSAYEALDTMLKGLFVQKGQSQICTKVIWE